MYFVTFWFGLVGVIPTIFITTLSAFITLFMKRNKILSNNFTHSMLRLWGMCMLFNSGIRLKVLGRENYNPKQPYIIVMNHSTSYDVFLGFWAIRGQFRYVSAEAIFKSPFIGSRMTAAQYISVRQGVLAMDAVEACVTHLNRGTSILIFPEARRIKSGNMARIKRGILHISDACPDIPILPLVIGGSLHARTFENYGFHPFTRIKARFLQPFCMKDIEGDGVAKLNYLQDLMQNAHDEMLEKNQKTAESDTSTKQT